MTHPTNILHPKPLQNLTIHLQGLIKGRLWLKILIAMVLGIGVGTLFSPSLGLIPREASAILGDWLALPGHLFLGLIQMIVVPLVFASVIRGLAASGDMEQLRRTGLRLGIYFMVTTTIAIVIGITIALLIRPGNFIDSSLIHSLMQGVPAGDAGQQVTTLTVGQVPQLIVNVLPANPLGAMVEKEMLQVVLFAVILGMALIAIAPEKSKPLLELLGSLQDVCMTIVSWAMAMAPLAVFGLLAQIAIKIGIEALLGMAVYVATVLLGLIVLLCFYLAMVLIVTHKAP
jgi:Na+/H+-dicarboxylate symporter